MAARLTGMRGHDDRCALEPVTYTSRMVQTLPRLSPRCALELVAYILHARSTPIIHQPRLNPRCTLEPVPFTSRRVQTHYSSATTQSSLYTGASSIYFTQAPDPCTIHQPDSILDVHWSQFHLLYAGSRPTIHQPNSILDVHWSQFRLLYTGSRPTIHQPDSILDVD